MAYIYGNSGNNYLVGTSSNDYLFGYAGNDTLVGGAGADVMDGGDNNDVYYVDNTGDKTGEIYNDSLGGVDTVYASASHTIGYGIENLYLTGTANIYGYGNANNNYISGNSGANYLWGSSGNDTMYGGNGNDTMDGGTGSDYMNGGDHNDIYYIDSTGDTAVETYNDSLGGVDTVYASASEVLGYGIENLYLTGSANIYGYGNANNNYISGNSGANYLYGDAGNDTMYGGNGNDTMNGGTGSDYMNGGDHNDIYYIDSTGDTAVETYNDSLGGVDIVYASASETLGYGIEHLYLTGTANIYGYGNTNNNTIVGNSGANYLWGSSGNDYLSGGSGNDTLQGGTGKDTLVGGAGNDVFLFASKTESPASSSGRDVISGFDFGSSTTGDKINLASIDANESAGGNQAFSTVEGTGVGQLSIVDLSNGNTLIQGNTSSAAGFEFAIEVVDGSTSSSYWSTVLDFVL